MREKRVPLGHRIQIRLETAEQISKGGIILHANDQELIKAGMACEKGIVTAIGKTAFIAFDKNGWDVEVGDTVIVKKYSGHQYLDGKDVYRVVNDDDLIEKIIQVED